MSADYLLFGDFDSRNLNMWLHDTGRARIRHLAPPKISVTDRALGTSGEILFDQYYSPKELSVDLFLENSILEERDLRQIATWLGQQNNQKLIFSFEPYKYYMATCEDQIDTEEFSGGLILNTLKFKLLNPFGYSNFTTKEIAQNGIYYDQHHYYDSGILYVEDMGSYSFSNMTNNQNFDIYNGGNCNFAFPIFEFTGIASTLKIEQFSDSARTIKIGEFNYGAFNGTLNVDCNLRNVFKNGTMSNNTFTGDYLSVNGITSPQFFNSGTLMNISGNTITLGVLASAVNDYYNGMSIYILNQNNCIMDKRTITDYVGSTKVATLDSAFTNAIVGQEYRIYNPKDGKNYFKITGTGFSSLGLTVNFRYVYL